MVMVDEEGPGEGGPVVSGAQVFNPATPPAKALKTAYDVTRIPADLRLGRMEKEVTYVAFGRLYRQIQRDKAAAEDWLCSQSRAHLFFLRTGDAFGLPPHVLYRKALLQTDTVI